MTSRPKQVLSTQGYHRDLLGHQLYFCSILTTYYGCLQQPKTCSDVNISEKLVSHNVSVSTSSINKYVKYDQNVGGFRTKSQQLYNMFTNLTGYSVIENGHFRGNN